MVWTRKGVWGLQRWRAIHMLHPPRPRPLHTLRDMGGGLQPTRNRNVWCHLLGYLRRGWVCLTFDPFLGTSPRCSPHGLHAIQEDHVQRESATPCKNWVEAWRIAAVRRSVISIPLAHTVSTHLLTHTCEASQPPPSQTSGIFTKFFANPSTVTCLGLLFSSVTVCFVES